MKKITLIFLLFSTICSSQNFLKSYLQLDTIIHLNNNTNRQTLGRINSKVIGNSLVFTSFNANSPNTCNYNPDLDDSFDDSKIHFVKINLDYFSIENIFLTNTKDIKLLSNFYYNDKYFAISTLNAQLILYEKLENKDYEYKSTIKLPATVRQFLKIDDNDKIFMGEIGFAGNKLNNEISVFDINTKKEVRSFNPDFKAPEFSFIRPLQCYDMSENKIFVSQTINYSIDVFNKNFKKIETITRKDIEWQSPSKKELDQAESLRKKRFVEGDWRSLILGLDRNIHRITQIFPVSDTSLIIEYCSPDPNNNLIGVFYDAWKLLDNVWVLHTRDVNLESTEIIETNPIYTKENPFILLSRSHVYTFSNNKFIFITTGPKFDRINKSCSEIREFESKNMHRSEIVVYIYSHSLFD